MWVVRFDDLTRMMGTRNGPFCERDLRRKRLTTSLAPSFNVSPATTGAVKKNAESPLM
jgi:hypothetical protein